MNRMNQSSNHRINQSINHQSTNQSISFVLSVFTTKSQIRKFPKIYQSAQNYQTENYNNNYYYYYFYYMKLSAISFAPFFATVSSVVDTGCPFSNMHDPGSSNVKNPHASANERSLRENSTPSERAQRGNIDGGRIFHSQRG